ncbi:MAG: hypothetical protein IT285_02985 [Bdellovibrionales bacterium]|nr:hypothetical protein [Bdellovibrionales bacterium]
MRRATFLFLGLGVLCGPAALTQASCSCVRDADRLAEPARLEPISEAALPNAKDVDPPQSIDTALEERRYREGVALIEQANALRDAGKPTDALPLYEKLLAEYAVVYDPDEEFRPASFVEDAKGEIDLILCERERGRGRVTQTENELATLVFQAVKKGDRKALLALIAPCRAREFCLWGSDGERRHDNVDVIVDGLLADGPELDWESVKEGDFRPGVVKTQVKGAPVVKVCIDEYPDGWRWVSTEVVDHE